LCYRYSVLICIGQPSKGLRGWTRGSRATYIYIPYKSLGLRLLRIRLLSYTLPNICLFVLYPIACLKCPYSLLVRAACLYNTLSTIISIPRKTLASPRLLSSSEFARSCFNLLIILLLFPIIRTLSIYIIRYILVSL
jgi:hypothetical protein